MNISPRQQKYLTILMNKEFGNNRALIYKHETGKTSSKDLTRHEASDLIEVLAPDSKNHAKIEEWNTLIKETTGQQSLF